MSRPSDSPYRNLFRVAAAQMIFAESLEKNLAKIERAIRRAARRRCDAILFPECATTGYNLDFSRLTTRQVRFALKAVGRFAALNQINVLLGSPVRRKQKWQNCLVVFDRSGQVAHCYAKCQLTARDREFFTPGDSVALFRLDDIWCTAIICHERRYPELVRLGVMAGAQIIFHPNAGLDSRAVSRRKHEGRDGIAIRAFENAAGYVFANSVGPQGDGLWSAGDSKIVAPDGRCLRAADNQRESLIVADIDLSKATRGYARESLEHPRFLRSFWRAALQRVRSTAAKHDRL